MAKSKVTGYKAIKKPQTLQFGVFLFVSAFTYASATLLNPVTVSEESTDLM